ncbi:MAG TPA: proteasome assembly chaperone family protein [Candidatus Methanofastidiosa archaeon]|nr:proteasome assembly chaperone family protein [Candidatus Methanofastidiosa archaeon]
MIDIVMDKDVSFKNPIVIEGFPGVGLVGHIAATYLVSALNIPEVGYIRTDLLPQISMIMNGKVIPPVRIYGNENLIVFISDLAFPDDKTFDMADKLGEFMKKNNVRTSLSLAGIGINTPSGKVYGVGSNDTMLSKLNEIGVETLNMGSISGGSGALLLECYRQGIPSVALLAETTGMRPDPRAASYLLEFISKIIDKNIDTQPLIKEAEQIESTLSDLSKDVVKKSGAHDVQDTMYI